MSTTYETIRYGNAGQSVRGLQTILKKKGYDVTVDGQFGIKTLKAVQDYQKKNRLNPTGIVMGKTWEKLRRDAGGTAHGRVSQTAATVQSGNDQVATVQAASAQPVTQTAAQSTSVQNASAQAAATATANTGDEAVHPGEYHSQYAQALEALYDQIMGRPAFSYDLSGDPLYRQYRQQYTTQGRLAMEDAIGAAAGLTGGYGSSYSQTAGQQTYGSYLQGLNDMIPQLYSLALDRYTAQGQQLQDQFAALYELEEQEYSRYSDAYDRYLALQELQSRLASSASSSASSGSSSGGSSRKTSSKSGSGTTLSDSRIRELASAYIISGYGSNYYSPDMRSWMRKQGISEAQYEQFYATLRAMGYKPTSKSIGGGGRETYSAIM